MNDNREPEVQSDLVAQAHDGGEILVSRQCENEREARYVAESARKDSLRTGSTAVQSDWS